MSISFTSRRVVIAAVAATVAGFAIAGAASASSSAPAAAPVAASPAAPSSSQIDPPVSVSLAGAFGFHSCPAGTPAADDCLTDHLTGTLPGIGAVTGTFEAHIEYSKFAADGCGPVVKQGSFTAADGSTVRISAHGMFCNSSSTAAYNYQVTGGTGRLAHASGSGQWLVPAPATYVSGNGTGAEFFFGSLHR